MKQILISVPDEWLEGTPPNLYDVMGAVMNGTVLPEHYGDLVDKKEVYKKFYSRCLAEVATEVLSGVTTIIPATKEGENE